MNWLDIALLVVLCAGFFYGLRVGLIGAAFIGAGVICGWQLAAHYADDLGEAVSVSPTTDTVATVIWYVLIIAVTVAAFAYARRLAGPVLATTTSGLSSLADRVGGVAVGAALGLLLVGASILGLARLAYDFRVPEISGVMAAEQLPQTLKVRDGLNGALVGSSMARSFVYVVDNIPADAIGFAPDDFDAAVLILKRRIDTGQY